MAEILTFRTPTGGRSGIFADREAPGHIRLGFQRSNTGAEGEEFKAESIALLSDAQAEALARGILKLLGKA